MIKYFKNGKKVKYSDYWNCKAILYSDEYTFVRNVGDKCTLYESRRVSIFGKVARIKYGISFQSHTFDTYYVNSERVLAFEMFLKSVNADYVLFKCNEENDYKFYVATKRFYAVYDIKNKCYIDVLGKSFLCEKAVRYLPEDYYEKLSIEGCNCYIKEDYCNDVVFLKDSQKKFVTAVLGYEKPDIITKDDYKKVEEFLKEERPVLHIKGTKEPPYFVLNDKVYEALEDENWYSFVTREFYTGDVQIWMLE